MRVIRLGRMQKWCRASEPSLLVSACPVASFGERSHWRTNAGQFLQAFLHSKLYFRCLQLRAWDKLTCEKLEGFPKWHLSFSGCEVSWVSSSLQPYSSTNRSVGSGRQVLLIFPCDCRHSWAEHRGSMLTRYAFKKKENSSTILFGEGISPQGNHLGSRSVTTPNWDERMVHASMVNHFPVGAVHAVLLPGTRERCARRNIANKTFSKVHPSYIQQVLSWLKSRYTLQQQSFFLLPQKRLFIFLKWTWISIKIPCCL